MINIYQKKYNEILKKLKEGKRMSPLKLIRQKCLECTNFQIAEVANCPIPECVLYGFRMGKNPFMKGKGGNISNLTRKSKTSLDSAVGK